MMILPSSGDRSPRISLSRVVFPAPFGPVSPTVSPCSTQQLTFRELEPPRRDFDTDSNFNCIEPVHSTVSYVLINFHPGMRINQVGVAQALVLAHKALLGLCPIVTERNSSRCTFLSFYQAQ